MADTTTTAATTTLTAARTHRNAGRAHVWTGQRLGPWFDTACGRSLSDPELVPWSSTAPEDRCKRCAEMHPGT